MLPLKITIPADNAQPFKIYAMSEYNPNTLDLDKKMGLFIEFQQTNALKKQPTLTYFRPFTDERAQELTLAQIIESILQSSEGRKQKNILIEQLQEVFQRKNVTHLRAFTPYMAQAISPKASISPSRIILPEGLEKLNAEAIMAGLNRYSFAASSPRPASSSSSPTKGVVDNLDTLTRVRVKTS